MPEASPCIFASITELFKFLSLFFSHAYHSLVPSYVFKYLILVDLFAYLSVSFMQESLLHNQSFVSALRVDQLVWLIVCRLGLITPQFITHKHVLSS